ncbi:hypothetical protein PLESTB_001150000 [Pleodorina starrii]|uniref:Uncharacterized protein n=1 Tax=Pleodorina starrii TaxID=330485 RepID=A0A9W6BSP0_9CHLO|nr:hypothetical protein PLESTB_001150000 [Pleodorina starrii]
MYAWGQYYASQAAPPPPQLSPPPMSLNRSCTTTAVNGCACKSSWQYNGRNYSYCDDIYSNGTLACEVVKARRCFSCKTHSRQCIKNCAGTAELCKRPPATLLAAGNATSRAPPPPFPPSPPPMPPPPPPDNIPNACKVSSSGCACRSSWSILPQIEFYGQYCTFLTSPSNSTFFGCLVTSDCPTFLTDPFQNCDPALNASLCDGSGRRWSEQQARKKPSSPRPPAPPRQTQPSPPRLN